MAEPLALVPMYGSLAASPAVTVMAVSGWQGVWDYTASWHAAFLGRLLHTSMSGVVFGGPLV